jgi:hypothetical protein
VILAQANFSSEAIRPAASLCIIEATTLLPTARAAGFGGTGGVFDKLPDNKKQPAAKPRLRAVLKRCCGLS